MRVPPGQELVIQDDLGGQIPKIEDGPWPAFPADLTSIAVVTATQARGTVLIFEKMFESRLFFVDKLVSMGARIILCDPHRVVVTGPAQLYGQRMASPDIRAGMAMLIAALCAEGTSTIGNVGEIDRGYERIDERLRALGAQIERVDGVATPGTLGGAIERPRQVDRRGGSATVATGLPVLDHLLDAARGDAAASSSSLEVAPGRRGGGGRRRGRGARRGARGAAAGRRRPGPRLGVHAGRRGARPRRARGLGAAAGRVNVDLTEAARRRARQRPRRALPRASSPRPPG